MSGGSILPTTDTGTVACDVTNTIDPAYFVRDGAYVATARIVGVDTVSGDVLCAEMKVAVSVIAGALTVGPVSTSLPLYAPNFPGLLVNLAADPPNMRVLVEIVGDPGLAGRFADIDCEWNVWGSGGT